MRNTVQRTLILKAVRSMHDHPTADEVYEKVMSSCPGISKGTVYRNLNLLAEMGEIRRVLLPNAPDRYDFTVENHAHCICRVCGRVSDYALRRMPELDDARNSGFKTEGYSVIANGVCDECRKKDPDAAGADKALPKHMKNTEKEFC